MTRESPPRVVGGAAVADEVTVRTLAKLLPQGAASQELIDDLLCETLYREQRRLDESDRDPRSAQDQQFVRWLRHALARADAQARRELLHAVVQRYAREISGHFDRRVYRVATRILPSALSALLAGGRPGAHLFDVDDRILLEGDTAGLQRAARMGTVVLVPTHVSNLDALVLGYSVFRLGLPPFAYGAGLNLFSNVFTGFFMRHLGAFTVDRKKLDPVYRATVKEYATVLLERDQHLLFFPGGTRSRSGAIEQHLKLGFLSRIVTAFANRLAREPHGPPLFVVPCTLSYPLVLEAASLIREYLDREGGPHFVDIRDEFEQPRHWYTFLSGLAELDVQVHVRFGSPLDPFGNPTDAVGRSLDVQGRPLDASGYLRDHGAIHRDEARDAAYTKLLAASLLTRYRRDSVALPSSVLAYAAFACLSRRYPRLDLFHLLRVLGPQSSVSFDELEPVVRAVLDALEDKAARAEIELAPELRKHGSAAVFARGIATLSTYHRPPVLIERARTLEILHPTLLLYYRNRLDGFGLPKLDAVGAARSPAWRAP